MLVLSMLSGSLFYLWLLPTFAVSLTAFEEFAHVKFTTREAGTLFLSLAAFPSCLYTTLVVRKEWVAFFFCLAVLDISSRVSG